MVKAEQAPLQKRLSAFLWINVGCVSAILVGFSVANHFALAFVTWLSCTYILESQYNRRTDSPHSALD